MTEQTIDQAFNDYKCPYCRREMSFPAAWVGSLQECPNCVESVVVPEAGVESCLTFPLPVKTPRLQLRRWAGTDAQALLQLMDEEESFRFVDWYRLAESEIEEWLQKDSLVRLTQNEGNLNLAVELCEGSKVIGFLSLYLLPADRQQAGFTLVLSASHCRKGLGTEAIEAALGFAFEGINLHRVSVWCHSRNIAARRALEKTGLRQEGEFLKARFQHGEWVDMVWYGLLREEYRQKTPS